jgi:hypothetical protein
LNASAYDRLIHQRTAAYVDTLGVQSVFFEDTVIPHNLQKIMGNADTAIANLDLGGFRLRVDPRRIKQCQKNYDGHR